MQATSEQFLLARAIFWVGLPSESHWIVTSAGKNRSLVARTRKCGWAISQKFFFQFLSS